MSPDEALKVCRLARALSPAQAIDQYTPEAWALVLKGWRVVDALDALEQLGAEQEWIHVSHIVGRIKRMRRDRVDDYGTLPQPPKDLDPSDTGAYQRWLKATTERIADGQDVPREQPGEVMTTRPMQALLKAGTSVPDVLADSRAKVRAAHAAARREVQANRKPEPEPLLDESDRSREPEPEGDAA